MNYGKGKEKIQSRKDVPVKKGWEKLRTYIGTDELWELESKK